MGLEALNWRKISPKSGRSIASLVEVSGLESLYWRVWEVCDLPIIVNGCEDPPTIKWLYLKVRGQKSFMEID
jgi:hypothetical protein